MWRIALTIALATASSAAPAQDTYPSLSPAATAAPPAVSNANSSLLARLPLTSDPLRPSVLAMGPPTPAAGSAYPGSAVYQGGNLSPGAGAADLTSPRPEFSPLLIDRPIQSTWYTRVDYFHWNERSDGADVVNEDGALLTLGYVRRNGCERFRAELFGGSVHYDGSAFFGDDGSSEPLSSTTNYLGVRGEYDFLMEPTWWPNGRFLLGVGTRFWFRDMPDDVTALGDPVRGYQEMWWTIYPYVGLETKQLLRDWIEMYSSLRVGLTAITYQRATLDDDVALYPKCGPLGQVELGLRTRRVFLAASFEAMTWGESDAVRGYFQPQSRMFTVGLKTGVSF